jgi:hypothetical protein
VDRLRALDRLRVPDHLRVLDRQPMRDHHLTQGPKTRGRHPIMQDHLTTRDRRTVAVAIPANSLKRELA